MQGESPAPPGPHEEPICVFRIPPFLELVPNYASRLLACLDTSQHGVRAHLAISEALSNAILYGALGLRPDCAEREPNVLLQAVHAARAVRGRNEVLARVSRWDELAVVVIKDPGQGFDWAAVSAEPEGGPVDALAIHGRGFFLMRLGCERVTWNEAGNEVSLWFTDGRPRRPGVQP